MPRKAEWVNQESLENHLQKHVVYPESKGEERSWEELYKNRGNNRTQLIRDNNRDKLLEIYERESKSVHEDATKIYIYKSDFYYSLNFVRESDNLLVGEKKHDNYNYKIHTCFFKDKIYIDTEILSAILALEKTINDSNIDKDIRIEDFSVYLSCQNYFKQTTLLIYDDYKHLRKQRNETDDAFLLRKKKCLSREILKCFLHQQLKYHNNRGTDDSKYPKAEYEFFMNFLLNRDIPASVSQDIIEKSAKAIKEIKNILIDLRKSGYSKEDEDYHFVEMTLIFYLLLRGVALNFSDEYDNQIKLKFAFVEEKYSILKKLLVAEYNTKNSPR